MFGYNSRIPDVESEYTKQEFCRVDDGLPSSKERVVVIGKKYHFSDCSVGTGYFDPEKGWRGDLEIVYAWRPMTNDMKRLIK